MLNTLTVLLLAAAPTKPTLFQDLARALGPSFVTAFGKESKRVLRAEAVGAERAARLDLAKKLSATKLGSWRDVSNVYGDSQADPNLPLFMLEPFLHATSALSALWAPVSTREAEVADSRKLGLRVTRIEMENLRASELAVALARWNQNAQRTHVGSIDLEGP